MKLDTRLSLVLHALLHMAGHGRTMTSADLALCMDTNPVVVRRTMAGLRRAGLVRSEKGHGGGWTLGRELAEISLRDVYAALGSPAVFALGNHTESPGCLIERAINDRLDGALREAEALLVARLGELTLADIWSGIADPFMAHQQRRKDHSHDQ
ncbi:Rrf2 family protein [Hoeflea marina]|uniref:Rrf2 family protein n=1 Tax=Hoeflea marina TaxID=274592 RepID=A0A317PPK4_9HYPH|nr:Rrf2 family transcriptional regulator [Hoeflea marina]PWW01848.1 Rrf2 family protein [Hoeflea marina]